MTMMPHAMIEKFCSLTGITERWLITGKEPMLKARNKPQEDLIALREYYSQKRDELALSIISGLLAQHEDAQP